LADEMGFVSEKIQEGEMKAMFENDPGCQIVRETIHFYSLKRAEE
jgi:hypothetical protein